MCFIVGLRLCHLGMVYLSPFGEVRRLSFVGLRSCRAGTYFCFATKVGKSAPKEEENPFMAGFLPPLETLIIPAGRGTPPGCARGLTAMVAFGLCARGWRAGFVYARAAGTGWRKHCIKQPSLAPVATATIPVVVDLLSWCMGRALSFAFRREGTPCCRWLALMPGGHLLLFCDKSRQKRTKGGRKPLRGGFSSPFGNPHHSRRSRFASGLRPWAYYNGA